MFKAQMHSIYTDTQYIYSIKIITEETIWGKSLKRLLRGAIIP